MERYMKKVILITIGPILGAFVILFLLLAFTCNEVFEDGFKPRIYTGEEAHAYHKYYFGMEIPAESKNLFYKYEGFQDSFYDLAMTVPPEAAWKFIKAYSGKNKSAFKKMDYTPGTPYNDINTPELKKYTLNSPVELTVKKGKDAKESIIYDEKTGNLIVHFFSW